MPIKRRELIRWGTAAGLAAVHGIPLQARADAAPNMTVIPSTGEAVPAIGLGTVSFKEADNEEAMKRYRETLSTFHSMGGTLLDTSPNYGRSEIALGRLMQDLGIADAMFLATKVDQEDSEGGIKRMGQSFRNLNTRKIDLMQVHNLIGTDIQLETMKAWKAEGHFRYLGVTTHRTTQHGDIETAMRKHPLDFIQVNYSVVDRAAEQRLLPMAQEKGVAVLVNRPFGRGALFKTLAGRALPGWAAEIEAGSWAQVLLKYVMSHPAATIPIPGTSKVEHARDNMQALSGPLPDSNTRRAMEQWFAAL
jgi:aryl-alcohol dehydrogenase-like predicted oxidoreductase